MFIIGDRVRTIFESVKGTVTGRVDRLYSVAWDDYVIKMHDKIYCWQEHELILVFDGNDILKAML